MTASLRRRRFLSLAIAAVAVALATAPLPGLRRPLLVAVGSELEEAMRVLEERFERRHGGIDLLWEVQGSQDMVNRSLDGGQERPRVVIPANQDQLEDLAEGLGDRGEDRPFRTKPQPIARTLLVAVAWPERAATLFPDGRFRWQPLRQAAAQGQWDRIGGPASWGSFDLRVTDPLRSNSGQLTLVLWCQGQPPRSCAPALKRALYRPARSTDILLREFISGGPNEGDVAMVYEAAALARQQEAERLQPGGYRLLVPDPSFETVLAAAVLRGVGRGDEGDGDRFVAFLGSPEGQSVLGDYGFRMADGRGGSPAADGVKRLPPPSRQTIEELLRAWQQAE